MAISLSQTANDAAVNAACDAIVDLLDGGAGAGRIVLSTAGSPITEVGTAIGQDPFFGSASGGVATQSGNAVDSAATGNASPVTQFDAQDSNGNSIFTGTVSTSGADLNLSGGGSPLIIDTNAVITISGITFTVAFA